ncbi:MAG TPA: SpoIIE family protein phosphatase [Pyrinomonadaceae bacterium]|jgi:sigma-B regulation protein RsbU (phosphoserine phosphatase)
MQGAGGAFDNSVRGGGRARAWLRRVMPHAALAAALVVLAWVVVKRAGLDRVGAVALLFDAAFVVVYLVALYYGARALRWLKNKLLWRVRRRLVITYLFVGLTPVVLLVALAALTGLLVLNQLASRVVKMNLAAREAQALEGARTLARGFALQPENADAKTVQAWLDDRVALLQSSLPGARVAVWRGEPGARGAGANVSSAADESRPAQFASEPGGREARAAGDFAPADAPLPAWLRAKKEWHGMAFVPPPDADASGFAPPSLRALVRERTGEGRGVTLLLVVPVGRELVRQLREATGLAVHPFFLGAEGTEVAIVRETFGGGKVSIGDPRARRRDPDNPSSGFFVVTPERTYRLDFRRDQFGEPTGTGSLVVMPAQDWADGRESLRIAFLCELSALAVARQLFAEEGAVRIGVIVFVAICFLLLELLALLSAAWMTRAVTGTVHRLYRATEFIKRGDFSHRVRVRSHDQLGELAEAFNEMSADIEALLEERVEREKLEREIEIAAEVQAQLFPREVPKLSGAEIAGECRAARGVAGDYYDYIELQPGLVVFTLADVSGKGISAALVMSNLQASLRAQTTILAERLKLSERVTVKGAAAGDGEDFEMPCGVAGLDADCAVENMAASINDQLCRSTDSNRFATVFLALYDERTRRLRYTNAGHNAPFLVRAGGAVERLDVGGTVLGAFDWARYEEAATAFGAGDLLLVFSDGITEARDESGEEYGDERLAEFARANRHLTTVDLRDAVFDEIDAWTGGRERDDDQTVVILKAPG